MNTLPVKIARIGLSMVVAYLVLFAVTLLPTGDRSISLLENVQGIPFPIDHDSIVVSQTLAHADIYLREPVIFKQLHVSFDYLPEATSQLAVGVRENSFWLSYAPHIFYRQSAQPAPATFQHADLTLPLSSALQEKDRSLDIMFIAGNSPVAYLANQEDDRTLWQIKNLRAEVTYALPRPAELRDYLRSVVTRERAL